MSQVRLEARTWPRCPPGAWHAHDIAHAVSYFASEAAGFITGQRLIVDGGRSLG